MASRRQRDFDRKYSQYRKTTLTEDVNYTTHSSRSAFHSETREERQDARGRSSSTEIVSGSDTRTLPVYIAVQEYIADANDEEAISLEQGQIVEVLDKQNPVRWLVRTKARPPQSGWVPGSYFETPTEYYKQRRRTREIEGPDNASDEQENLLKREWVFQKFIFFSYLHMVNFPLPF
ncbi:unnamed protein product, partial [Mesorhabditis spiculigera]